MNLEVVLIPIMKNNDSFQIWLEERTELYGIRREYENIEMIEACYKELLEDKLDLLGIILKELSFDFNSIPLFLDNVIIHKEVSKIVIYCLVYPMAQFEFQSYKAIDIKKLDKINQYDKSHISKLIKKDLDLSAFGCVPSDKKSEYVIAFDCGGVLFEWNDNRFFDMMGKTFGCEPKEFSDIFLKDWCRYALHVNKMTHENVCEYISEKTYNTSFLSYVRTYLNSVYLINENIEILNKLKELYPHITFIITSNLNYITEQVLLNNEIIRNSFDKFFFSWRMKVVKPKYEFYEYIQNVVKTNNIFFIDDNLDNVNAAKHMGWTPYFTKKNEAIDFDALNNEISKWLNRR